MKEYKVSVVIPMYGVEQFIAKCAHSLLNQTLQEVEFIFVNDATKDNSIEVLGQVIEQYPQRGADVRIITHKENKGLPSARNTGLAMAKGEYVFHCDGDDFVEPDMLEVLYDEAKNHKADIVWCDWFLSFGTNERKMKQPDYATPTEALKAMLGGAMKYNVWNKLAKRSLYVEHSICFPDGYGMGEDMTMLLLFAHAQKVVYVPKPFYHYVKMNTGAFSQTFSEKHQVALKYNVQRTSEYLRDVFGHDLDQEIAFLQLEAKFPFLIMSGNPKFYRLWEEWYPEANRYIPSNKNICKRNRFVQWCAWKGQFWLVWLHYQLIIKVVYGIIYR